MGTLGKAAGVARRVRRRASGRDRDARARPRDPTCSRRPRRRSSPRRCARAFGSFATTRARHAHLAALIARFRARMRGVPWTLLESQTPIQPLVVGANAAAVELAGALWQRGFWVPAIRPPTVPKGTARLRITLTAAHTLADVDALADALAELAPAVCAGDRRDERGVARRIGRRRSAARPAARLGDALGNLGAAGPEARAAVPRARGRPARPRPQPARGAVHARRRGRGGCLRAAPSRRARSPCSAGRWAGSSRCAGRSGTPTRVATLALVCTSPRFVAADDWPHAMSRETLARFGDELHVAWKLTIQRFLALQMHGSEHGRATLAALRSEVFARGEPAPKALVGALDALIGRRPARRGWRRRAAGARRVRRSRHAGASRPRAGGSPSICRTRGSR